MDLREHFWTILLFAIILVSVVIVISFIFINFCISKRVARYSTQEKPNDYDGTKLKKQDNHVHHINLENEKPPLPPRDQFMSTVSVKSYEEVVPVPDYVVVEESTPPAPQQPIFTPQYTTVDKKSQDQDQDSEDYDDVETPANYNSDEDYDDVA